MKGCVQWKPMFEKISAATGNQSQDLYISKCDRHGTEASSVSYKHNFLVVVKS